MEIVIGIDLGTTNSCVAMVEAGHPIVIPNKAGYKTTPSMIAIADGGKLLVGHLAKRQAITNYQNTVFGIKRLIGRKYHSPEVKKTIETSPFEIFGGQNGDPRVRLASQEFSLPQISAAVLQEMRRIAEDHLGRTVSKCVITVPAYFNDGQRQATKDAGRISGLEVIRIINEPTAAALAYGFGKDIEKKVAVFDLGGGTFDISVLEIGNNVYEVVATAGDTFLGGEDFDRLLIDHLSSEFRQQHGIELREDRMALQRLKDAAEKAKCDLSEAEITEVSLPFITVDTAGSKHLKQTITRKTLEALISPLIDRTIETTAECLKLADMRVTDIDEVILVGGSTRIPLVQRRVQEFFKRSPCKSVHPDEVVALGAGIQGSALVTDTNDVLLLDVTPMSLGITTAGGIFRKLIERNTTIPTQASEIFTTSQDNQTAVKIHVLQGESDVSAQNELLGEFLLTGIRKARRGDPEIEVTFSIDSDGIVHVSAKDLETGKEQSITVTASSGLTEDDVHRMKAEADQYALSIRNQEKIQKLDHESSGVVERVRALLSEKADKVGAKITARGEELIDAVQAAIQSGDDREVKQRLESLERFHQMLRGLD